MSFEVYPIRPPAATVDNDNDAWGNERQRFIAECDHEMHLSVVVKGNGQRIYAEQCLVCGMTENCIGASLLTAAQKGSAHARNVEAEKEHGKRVEAHMRAWWNSRQDAKKERDSKSWWGWYNTYLQSDIWKRKREQVLARAGGVCSACRKNPPTDVHHLTYARVGAEPLFDLAAVCHKCHSQLHPNGDL